MNTWLLIARSIHFASTMLLFGGLLFVLVIAMPAWRDAGFAVSSEGQAFWRKLTAVAAWSIVASLASGLAWLAFEAAMMSGLPVTQAMHRDTLALVLGKTEFGRLWTLRFGLALALAALLWTTWRSEDDSRKRHWAVVALVVAAAYLAALAWAGHAAAGEGRGRYVQLVSDVIHLLCAAAWLGALPGLALLLGSVAPLDIAARAARRFSTLGVTSVSALALSGLVNAWFLVGDVPALVGTPYGRLLSGKLAFFAAMVIA